MALVAVAVTSVAASVSRSSRALSGAHEGHVEPEWGGIFDLTTGTHSWNFCKKGTPEAYADAEVRFLATATTESTVTTALQEAAEEAFEAFTGSHTEDTVTLVPGTTYQLELEATKTCTVFNFAISADSHYAIFLQHAPAEFEGNLGHYLKDASYANIEAEATWKAATTTSSTGQLPKSKRWGYSILASFITGMMIFFGALVWFVCEKVGMGADMKETVRVVLRSFASGVLLALVFIHLMGEVYLATFSGLEFNWKPLCTICAGGVVGLMMLLLPEHHGAHTEAATPAADQIPKGEMTEKGKEPVEGEAEPAKQDPEEEKPVAVKNHSLGYLIGLGDLMCNFLDGVLIGAAFWSCSSTLGWKVMGAVICHELPGECADFSILIDSGFSVLCAIVTQGIAALFAVLGAIVVCAMNEEFSTRTNTYFVCFGAGVITVVAVSNFNNVVAHGDKSHWTWKMYTSVFVALCSGVTIMTSILAKYHEHCDTGGTTSTSGGHAGHGH